MNNLWTFELNSYQNISFLWGHEHDVYATASFAVSVTSWYLRNGMQTFIRVILYMNIICIVQWLSDANIDILHYSSAFAQHPIIFKPYSNFKQTCVIFLQRKYDVISQLCHSYVKGPFCVTRFNSLRRHYNVTFVPLKYHNEMLVKVLE